MPDSSSFETRHVVRKSSVQLADFDEQGWPVTLLLLGTAGAMVAFVALNPNSDFEAAAWQRNAWIQIGSIVATALILIAGVAIFRGSSQRRLQLGVFLSLLIHASILFAARQYYLSVAANVPSEPDVTSVDALPVTIPDYHQNDDDSPTPSELTRPAETTIRDEATIELTPQTPEQLKAEKKTAEEPEPIRDLPTPTIELARVDPTTPQPNQILPNESLVRRELERNIQTETVQQQALQAAKELNSSLSAHTVDPARREAALEPTRRLDTATPRALGIQPTTSPLAPQRRVVNTDQTAAADVAAELARRLTPAATPALPNTPIETAAAQPAEQTPLDAPKSAVQAPQRQSSAPSVGVVAAIPSPAIALAPGSAAQTSLSRAEASDSSDTVSVTLPTERLQRMSPGGAAVGVERVAVDTPNAPTSIAPGPSGGATPEAALTTVARGNQGTLQSPTATDLALPSPLGKGSGTSIGSPSVGPLRRSDAAGDGTAGTAAAANLAGRPGRGRSVGSATAIDTQLVGGGVPAVTGPVARSGNSTSESVTDPTTSVAGSGASLGQRTVQQNGEGLRPATLGGITGIGATPTAGAGTLGGGGATTGIPGGSGAGAAAEGAPGTSTGTGSGAIGVGGIAGGSASNSAAPARRELGELAGSSSGSAAETLSGGRRARMDQSEGQRDRHGNLKGSMHDLIVDGQMVGEKVMIITFYVDEDIEGSPLLGALAAKGYAVERVRAPLPPVADFARQLDGVRQLWLISSKVNRLPTTHLREVVNRWRNGRLALCLMADNAPFTAEAIAVLNTIAPGTTITGDYLGEQKLNARTDGGSGFDPQVPLFHNVETLFEGTTISHIQSRTLTPVCFASNGLPLIGIYQQQGSSRLLVHCGFTSLYERFWDDAGVSRFAVNVAGWLSEADKKTSAQRSVPTR